jgi:hypothetical protein
MTTRRSWRSFVVQLQWIEMRTGLERATSCHDHDGFQVSPRQIFEVIPSWVNVGLEPGTDDKPGGKPFERSIHVDAALNIPFEKSQPEKIQGENLNGRRSR